MSEPSESRITLGVIMERRRTDSPWTSTDWRPLALLPSPAAHVGRCLRDDGRSALILAAHLPLALEADEATDYLGNIARARPEVYVVLRPAGGAAGKGRPAPFLLTASADAAGAYAEGGDAVVPVPMPHFVLGWIGRFVEAHPVMNGFERRRRRDREGRASAPPRPGSARIRHPVWRGGGGQ